MAGDLILEDCPICGVPIESFRTVTKQELRGKNHTSPFEQDDLDSVRMLNPCGHVVQGDVGDALMERMGANLIHHYSHQLGITRND